MNHYLHAVPGRIRVKTPLFKRNPYAAAEAVSCVEALSGVREVSVNAITGSMTVRYDHCLLDQEAILDRLEECGCFDRNKAVGLNERLHTATTQAGRMVGRALLSQSLGLVLDEAGLSFLAVLI